MILGIGYDRTDVRRIERVLVRYSDRFTHRVFAASERATCDRRRLRAACYAKRFAAKEACAKALGTGIGRGVYWRDMVVDNDAYGAPKITLHGGAERYLSQRVKQHEKMSGGVPTIHVTLSDEGQDAVALVIIEVDPVR